MKTILFALAFLPAVASAQTFPVYNLTVSGTAAFANGVTATAPSTLAGATSSGKISVTGTSFSNTGIASNLNGNWFTSADPDITYHSVVGDAFNQYFTGALTQFTVTQAAPQFQSGLTVNFHAPSGTSGSSGGILISGEASGSGSMWGQANDIVVDSSWQPSSGVVYNTEFDITNNSHDPLGSGGSINDVVLGGFPGTFPILAYMSIYEPNPGSTGAYGSHYGIEMLGNYVAKDADLELNTASTRSIEMKGSHALGIDMSGSTFSSYPIEGPNFNVDTSGHFNTTSDERLKTARNDVPLDGLSTLERVHIRNFEFRDRPGVVDEGVFAQELYPVYPQCVHRGGADAKTEPWSVDYGCLTPLLIKSIQELAANRGASK